MWGVTCHSMSSEPVVVYGPRLRSEMSTSDSQITATGPLVAVVATMVLVAVVAPVAVVEVVVEVEASTSGGMGSLVYNLSAAWPQFPADSASGGQQEERYLRRNLYGRVGLWKRPARSVACATC